MNPGDQVRLRSGGPPMTVLSTSVVDGDTQITVAWHTDGHLYRDTLPAVALAPVKDRAIGFQSQGCTP